MYCCKPTHSQNL